MAAKPTQMMVRVLQAFSLGGGKDVYAGTILPMETGKALEKIRQGKVEAAPADARPREAAPYRKSVVTNRDPQKDPATV